MEAIPKKTFGELYLWIGVTIAPWLTAVMFFTLCGLWVAEHPDASVFTWIRGWFFTIMVSPLIYFFSAFVWPLALLSSLGLVVNLFHALNG